jgi:hypothetical protein
VVYSAAVHAQPRHHRPPLVGPGSTEGVERGSSFRKIAVGQHRYYERQVAQGADDYYSGRGEMPGHAAKGWR